MSLFKIPGEEEALLELPCQRCKTPFKAMRRPYRKNAMGRVLEWRTEQFCEPCSVRNLCAALELPNPFAEPPTERA